MSDVEESEEDEDDKDQNEEELEKLRPQIELDITAQADRDDDPSFDNESVSQSFKQINLAQQDDEDTYSILASIQSQHSPDP